MECPGLISITALQARIRTQTLSLTLTPTLTLIPTPTLHQPSKEPQPRTHMWHVASRSMLSSPLAVGSSPLPARRTSCTPQGYSLVIYLHYIHSPVLYSFQLRSAQLKCTPCWLPLNAASISSAPNEVKNKTMANSPNSSRHNVFRPLSPTLHTDHPTRTIFVTRPP